MDNLLISQLTRLGASPGRAARAIAAALRREETAEAIGQRIARLADYAACHRTIHNPGQWALDYIATGCELPAHWPPTGTDYSGYHAYLTEADDPDPA